jgi:hypothetical protein
VNRRSSGFDGNPKPKKPIGFGRHGASEENRQGFGFDGDPNRDKRSASVGTRSRPKRPTSFGWHGISERRTAMASAGRGDPNGEYARASAGAELREYCQGFGRNNAPNGELLAASAKSRDPTGEPGQASA